MFNLLCDALNDAWDYVGSVCAFGTILICGILSIPFFLYGLICYLWYFRIKPFLARRRARRNSGAASVSSTD